MLLSTPLLQLLALSAVKAANTPDKVWPETSLRPHTTVDEPPHSLLLALKGSVYNVTDSPRFYGEGGPYHHFTGRDASRAWVTECWDDEDQLTWRMDGLEEMFMPRYLDELMDDLASGEEVEGLAGMERLGVGKEQMVNMAKTTREKFGSVSESVREERRKEDLVEAKQKVEDALQHWVGFFEGKYPVVGTVEYDEEGTPAAPKICEKAMQKRPVKGGKLEALMKSMGGMMGGKDAEGGKEGEMPDFVKEKLKQKQAAAAAGNDAKDEL